MTQYYSFPLFRVIYAQGWPFYSNYCWNLPQQFFFCNCCYLEDLLGMKFSLKTTQILCPFLQYMLCSSNPRAQYQQYTALDFINSWMKDWEWNIETYLKNICKWFIHNCLFLCRRWACTITICRRPCKNLDERDFFRRQSGKFKKKDRKTENQRSF